MQSKITVMAKAPSREAGLAFMEATGVAVLDPETGQLVPTVQAVIYTNDMRDGSACTWSVPADPDNYYVNVQYYGDSAAALQENGDPDAPDLFDRAPGLFALSEMRTGLPMTWTALSNDPVPPGYENQNGIRLYDPDLIATPSSGFSE